MSNKPEAKYMFYRYEQANDKKHKLQAVFHNRKTGREKRVKFGAEGYEDYTVHKDKNRQENYIVRHEKRENWNDPMTAGFHSRWVLWNKPDFDASVRDAINRMMKLGY